MMGSLEFWLLWAFCSYLIIIVIPSLSTRIKNLEKRLAALEKHEPQTLERHRLF